MARQTPQRAYGDYRATRWVWWPDFYGSVHSVPPVVHPYHESVLRLLDAAWFQAELGGLLYVIDAVFVLVQDRMEAIPCDLVFSYTINTFLKSQDEIETKS